MFKNYRKVVSLILILLMLSSLLFGCKNESVEDKVEEDNEKDVEEVSEKTKDMDTDIVVIGAGGAGLTAALEASENGKDVVLVEKMDVVGGNTLRATGGINAAESSIQDELDIEDSTDIHYDDTMEGGHDKSDPELLRTLVDNAADSIDWLIEKGADLSDVGRLGGASNDRAHRPEGGKPVGPHLIEVLKENVEKSDVELLLGTEAIEIVFEDGVKGIKARNKDGEEFNINSDSVIITTGGFGANSDMVVEYKKELEGFGTTNHEGATGDGIKLAEDIGADLVQMDEIQIHPTVIEETGFMITEAVRGNGAILINRDGERFINEMDTRDVVSGAILEQEGESAYLLFGNEIKESLEAIEGYIEQGLTVEGDSLEDLAKEIDIDPNALEETVKKYNEYVESDNDEDFNRPDLPEKIEEGKFYAIEISPAVHHTMGGIKINTNAEVLDKDNNPIPGLYAAGEVTGGIHGGNRLGGNALADIITYGLIAGKSASK